MIRPVLNPFENNIVYEVRRIDTPVAGLNQEPMNKLLAQFQSLERANPPRYKRKLYHAQFVTSSEPGYGKSFLIGRLFQKLTGRANLIYISPFHDPETAWKSILMRLVQELEFPENVTVDYCSKNEPSQLEAFAHGVLTNLTALSIVNGTINVKNDRDKKIDYLRNVTIEKLRKLKQIPAFIERNIPASSDEIKSHIQPLNASPLSWLNVLFQIAYNPSDTLLKAACLAWLKGGSIDEQEADNIGIQSIDIPGSEMSATSISELCKQRIIDFCRLASFYRPFVLCFDQTENYGLDVSLARALGVCIETLCREAENQMTVVTANLKPWNEKIAPHLDDAHIDRLSDPPHQLIGLTRQQAEELIHLRLKGWQVDKEAKKHILDSKWLNEWYKDASEIGIRRFLKDCSKRWLDFHNKSTVKPTLDDLYEMSLADVKSQPKKQVFNLDALYWLVLIFGNSLKDFSVKKEKSAPNGYFILKWKLKNKTIWFGFEPGQHWRRWHAIVREAELNYKADNKCKFVIIRTPELPKIPIKNWANKTREPIDVAKKTCLHILVLDIEEMIQIYTAYELYLDAMEGNIDYIAEEVLNFLYDKLQPILDIIQSPPPFPNGRKNGNGDPSEELISEVRKIVKKEKFLSFADLMVKLLSTYPEEMIFKAIGCISNIKVIPGPKMTVLQWQSKR